MPDKLKKAFSFALSPTESQVGMDIYSLLVISEPIINLCSWVFEVLRDGNWSSVFEKHKRPSSLEGVQGRYRV